MMKSKSLIIAISFGFLLAIVESSSATLVAVSWDFDNSPVHRISESTGSGSHIGDTGFARLNSLARNSLGEFYSIGTVPHTYTEYLVTIDPNTGAATMGSSVSVRDFRGLAFSSSDVLYGITQSRFGDHLVTVDVGTGAVTTIGDTGLPGIQALAFSPSGTLYAWDVGRGTGAGLVTVDTATGLATDVDPTVDGNAYDVQGFTFSPDGTLYGARTSLFTIDTNSGSLSLVGHGIYNDVRGLDFILETPAPVPPTTAVPEPCSLLVWTLLVAFGLTKSKLQRRTGSKA